MIGIMKDRVIRYRLSERIVDVKDDSLQIDFRQCVGSNKIEIIARILEGLVQIRDINDGNAVSLLCSMRSAAPGAQAKWH